MTLFGYIPHCAEGGSSRVFQSGGSTGCKLQSKVTKSRLAQALFKTPCSNPGAQSWLSGSGLADWMTAGRFERLGSTPFIPTKSLRFSAVGRGRALHCLSAFQVLALAAPGREDRDCRLVAP